MSACCRTTALYSFFYSYSPATVRERESQKSGKEKRTRATAHLKTYHYGPSYMRPTLEQRLHLCLSSTIKERLTEPNRHSLVLSSHRQNDQSPPFNMKVKSKSLKSSFINNFEDVILLLKRSLPLWLFWSSLWLLTNMANIRLTSLLTSPSTNRPTIT